MPHPQTLLESWLPFDLIGAESMRERGASSALPPLYFLHVWWARKPLAISRAAIAASLLPSWTRLQEALTPPPAPSPLPLGEGRGLGEEVRAAFPRPSRELIEQARLLRQEATTAEAFLWELLRNRQLLGAKFRRQYPMARFIADFFCHEASLVIEVDGAVHQEPTQRERDQARDEIIRQYGCRVLRFTNREVLEKAEYVLETIAQALTPPPAPSPLPLGEGRGLGEEVRAAFPSEADYQAWFLRLLGIRGDPAAVRKQLLRARETGENLGPNPYGYARAFTVNPSAEDLALFAQLTTLCSGDSSTLTVLDPFSGGGSIPFEARRYGLAAIANELNPVAAVILAATLDYPARFGPALAAEIKKWGRRWARLAQQKLAAYFPKDDGENIFAYLWARTVACPVTGKPVPLSPNWWLSKDPPVAVRLLTDPAWDEPRFEIVHLTPTPGGYAATPSPSPGSDAPSPSPSPDGRGGGGQGEEVRAFDPDEGTVSRGVGRSPWSGDAIDGDYIKAEAQAGRIGQTLYAVVIKRKGGSDFRAPSYEDYVAVHAAEKELIHLRPHWEAQDIIPTEEIGISNYDRGHRLYGIYNWADFFAPRQLLALGTFVETLRELGEEMRAAMDAERAAAVETYLAVMMDKAAIYNNRACRFDPGRGIRSVFDRHNFAFTWSHAEFDASANLLPWCISQVADAYRDLAGLLTPTAPQLGAAGPSPAPLHPTPLTLLQGSATDLSAIASGSVNAIVTDPPYYDNVMYAELADFFYVWLKRTVGHLYPQWFAAQLTDKDSEAVANPARFADLGRKKKELAEKDYERKMAAAFREMHRVLRDDGVLTVMFTHKRVEAWDTLASALIGAGFSVESSWPVHTESEHSLHQAKKNAAQSTILLCCRKRGDKGTGGQGDKETKGREDSGTRGEEEPENLSPCPLVSLSPGLPVWWDDIAGEVRRVAREKAAEFAAQGIGGVDLYLSTFGPALSVISRHWPVLTREVDERTGQPRPLRPETALDLAREEVIRLRKQGLLLGREVQFDPPTDWALMAWDAFQAVQFPADEARKLAIALGLDVEADLVRRRVVSKTGSDVLLLPPKQRRARGRVDPQADSFDTWLDAVHTAMLVYAEDGGPACAAWLKRTGLLNDSTFKACLQALLNAVPRTRVKGKFVRPEAEVLERLRLAFFEELVAPAEEEPQARPEQLTLL